MDCKKIFPRMMEITIWSTLAILTITGPLLIVLNEWVNDNGFLYHTMHYNWSTRYIRDIRFVKGACPKDFQTAVLGAWTGTGRAIFLRVIFLF